jgi:hypothetical protein
VRENKDGKIVDMKEDLKQGQAFKANISIYVNYID